MSVTVKWARDRLSFALPDPATPVSAIRRSLADHTGIPYDAFKLIHKGAVIRDDSAPIDAYHITANSVIQLLPTTGAAVKHVPTSTDEQTVLQTIHTELATVRSSLTPDLNDLLQRSTSPTQTTSEQDKKEYLRIGELLLQSLLRLDAIAPERDWEQARAERKAAVKEVQALLDTLDDTVAARRAAGLHS